jgi:hypothetical protein
MRRPAAVAARKAGAGSIPSPLAGPSRERGAAKRRGEEVQRARPYPTKAPLTPILSHSSSQTRVNALMLRSRLGHASRCARGEGPTEFARGTAVPNRYQAYSIRADCALISRVPVASTTRMSTARPENYHGARSHRLWFCPYWYNISQGSPRPTGLRPLCGQHTICPGYVAHDLSGS